MEQFTVTDGGLIFMIHVDRQTLDAKFHVGQAMSRPVVHSGNLKDEITARDRLLLAQGNTRLYVKDGAVRLSYDWLTGMTPRKDDVEITTL